MGTLASKMIFKVAAVGLAAALTAVLFLGASTTSTETTRIGELERRIERLESEVRRAGGDSVESYLEKERARIKLDLIELSGQFAPLNPQMVARERILQEIDRQLLEIHLELLEIDRRRLQQEKSRLEQISGELPPDRRGVMQELIDEIDRLIAKIPKTDTGKE